MCKETLPYHAEREEWGRKGMGRKKWEGEKTQTVCDNLCGREKETEREKGRVNE